VFTLLVVLYLHSFNNVLDVVVVLVLIKSVQQKVKSTNVLLFSNLVVYCYEDRPSAAAERGFVEKHWK